MMKNLPLFVGVSFESGKNVLYGDIIPWGDAPENERKRGFNGGLTPLLSRNPLLRLSNPFDGDR
jgi:hypothetical protein